MANFREDENHGITRLSTEYLETHLPKVGKIDRVVGKKDEDYWVVFIGEKGSITVSGFSWGYGGEGPHELLKALHKVGFEDVDINMIAGISSDCFVITWSNPIFL